MNTSRATKLVAGTAIAVAAAAVGWRYYDAFGGRHDPVRADASNTAVLGSNGPPPATPVASTFPRAPAPRDVTPDTVDAGDGRALAAWVQDGRAMASLYESGAWSAPQPLENIPGDATDLELAGNAHGMAMAVWRHTLGEIQSLRYARWEAAQGWGAADVIAGVLPRRLNSGVRPSLVMDPDGAVTLQWPSGFGGTSAQVTRFEPGRGWTQPLDVAAR